MWVDYIGLIANVSALSVAGILYAAYLKNLRSQIGLKEEQLKVAKSNVSLWKDKALELERQTPQYIEKVLSERIRIREEELQRLTEDRDDQKQAIQGAQAEIAQLQKDLDAAREFGRGISVYDADSRGFKQVPVEQLSLVFLSEIYVDSAPLIICDPLYLHESREEEEQLYPTGKYFFKNIRTGDKFWTDSKQKCIEIEGTSERHSVEELVKMGCIEELPNPKELPVDAETYIKSKHHYTIAEPTKSRRLSFYNGLYGAGIAINSGGDGTFPVYGEVYDGRVYRIYIDL